MSFREKYSVLEKYYEKYKDIVFSVLIFAICPLVLYFAVEYMDENEPFSIATWKILWNIAWYLVLLVLAWTITGRRRLSEISVSVIMYIFGLANHYVLRFRGRCLFPSDIMAVKTAANVADAFDYTPDTYMFVSFACVLLYIILVLLTKKEKKKAPVKLRLVSAAALLIFFFVFFFTPLLPNIDLYAQQWVTNRNGFLLNFNVSLRYSRIEKPEDYDKNEIYELQSEYISDSASDSDEITPVNIIVIMNESLADFSIYDNFKSSTDPLEFYHSLEENTVKGYIYSPVQGGGTANVEYEFLTGNTTAYLPDGTVVYQLYLDNDVPSLASYTSRLGYNTYAFHPYLSSGWNRIAAYKRLGFDTQLYVEDVINRKTIREYVSDASDYDTIKQLEGETDEKTFFFNVTMQNHSGYGKAWTNLSKTCVTEMEGNYKQSTVNQYLSLIDESDEALKELIEYYEDYDEPTLIVMFGDHQPPLSDRFYEALYGKEEENLSSEELLQEYVAPFFIWANYDIPEQKDVKISINYLGVLMAECANLPLSGYMKYLKETMEELPVVNPIGYIDSNGDFSEKTADNENKTAEILEKITYFNVFDLEKEEDLSFYYSK